MSYMDLENRINHAANRVAAESREFVGEHPMPTVLAAFGCGLASGLALAYLFTEDAHQRRDDGFAHRIGRQVMDAMSHAVPQSLACLRR